MIPKKPAPDLIRGENRFSDKIMLSERQRTLPTGGRTMNNRPALTRRQYLAATGASALALGLGAQHASAQMSVRQGYQTNIWGMPTYYLMRSGALEKRGV